MTSGRARRESRENPLAGVRVSFWTRRAPGHCDTWRQGLLSLLAGLRPGSQSSGFDNRSVSSEAVSHFAAIKARLEVNLALCHDNPPILAGVNRCVVDRNGGALHGDLPRSGCAASRRGQIESATLPATYPPTHVGMECSVDGGGRWGVAQLDYVGSSLTWVPWSYEWSPQSTGTHELVDRATDGEGRPQTVNERWIVP